MRCEIKRRTRVVQVFPSFDSLLRLVGAVCCDQNDAWLASKNFIDPRSLEPGYEREPPARGAGRDRQGTEARPHGVQQEEEGGVASGADSRPREGPYTTFRDATKDVNLHNPLTIEITVMGIGRLPESSSTRFISHACSDRDNHLYRSR